MASYVGISETVVHFVIYEAVKAWLITHRSRVPTDNDGSKMGRDFIEFMAAGAMSKTVASCIAYPHGESLYVTSALTIIIALMRNVFPHGWSQHGHSLMMDFLII